MKNQFGVSEVNEVMKSRGITRKSAVRFLHRDAKTGGRKAAVASALDVKMAAANKPVGTVDANKQSVARVAKKSDAGAARAEGLRLYKVAGRPSKQDVTRVYGTKKAIAWTWAHRAKVLELATAEEAAVKFQEMLKKAL
jgi:hypothetical protein